MELTWFILASCCLLVKPSLSMAVDALAQASTCTYTFNVPRDGASCLPGGTQTHPDIDSLQSTMTNQHAILEQQLNVITEKLVQLNGEGGDSSEEGDSDEGGNGSNWSAVGGTTYTHWGRTTCPDTAELIYEGMYVVLFHHKILVGFCYDSHIILR